ncbi:MAG: amidohydrolase [Pedobacter sp.]|nr:MAG: amidohydrolase [Pedobacter sp.]
MVSYISASYVYTIIGEPIKNGVVGLDAEGTITEVLSAEQALAKGITDVKTYEGLIVPGFVNTHCHLELSTLKGVIEKHTGLVAFVQQVMNLRTVDEYLLDTAMLRADIEMFECGIAAVADISNQSVSRMVKRGSLIYYHTFVEALGFDPEKADAAMARALNVRDEFAPLPVSIVPHAPYSVSAQLFESIKILAEHDNSLLSIHNQESAEENTFFESIDGEFLELYYSLGLDISFFDGSGKSSLQTYLPLLSVQQKILLVHNTFTSIEDIAFAKAQHDNLYWCLCPNANLYIENKLPDVQLLQNEGLKITLGTDSLASNDRLSLFAEMFTLQEQIGVKAADLLKWATFNGAEFMGIEDRFGSIETGKRPGINLLGFKEVGGNVVLTDFIKRLY